METAAKLLVLSYCLCSSFKSLSIQTLTADKL